MRNPVYFCVAAALAAFVSQPAAATTLLAFSFGGTNATPNSFNIAGSGLAISAVARTYTVLPTALSSLSQLSAGVQLRREGPGIGVNGGASNAQIDTNSVREGILVTGSRDISLAGLRLSFVDNDDTLQVYGVRGNQMVSLGYPGVIRRGLGGSNASLSLLGGQATGPAYQASLNNGTQSLVLVNPTAYFDALFFTTRQPGNVSYLGSVGQGYRIDSLTLGVPEPASWAMLIAGFGLVGAASRRRRAVVAA